MRAKFESIAKRAPAEARAILDFLILRDPKEDEPDPFGRIETDLYHGSPIEELDNMLLDGITPQDHGILGGNWFCVSPNDNVLRYFGDNGTHGFLAEDVALDHCILLGKRQIDLFMELACGDTTNMVQTEAWFEARGIDIYRMHTDDLHRAWRRLPEEVQAFVWPGCHEHLIPNYRWQGNHQSEAEVSLTLAGCAVFQRAITQVIRNGEWLERPTEFQLELQPLVYDLAA